MSKEPQLYRFTVGDPDDDDDGYTTDVIAFSIESALSMFRECHGDDVEPSLIECEGSVEMHDEVRAALP